VRQSALPFSLWKVTLIANLLQSPKNDHDQVLSIDARLIVTPPSPPTMACHLGTAHSNDVIAVENNIMPGIANMPRHSSLQKICQFFR
jgi:hypothetical protein